MEATENARKDLIDGSGRIQTRSRVAWLDILRRR